MSPRALLSLEWGLAAHDPPESYLSERGSWTLPALPEVHQDLGMMYNFTLLLPAASHPAYLDSPPFPLSCFYLTP